jgi:hypothetical protein
LGMDVGGAFVRVRECRLPDQVKRYSQISLWDEILQIELSNLC